jgi:hypothetical protein
MADVEGATTIQALLNEMKSLKKDVTSTKADIEAIQEGSPLASVVREIKPFKKDVMSTQATIVITLQGVDSRVSIETASTLQEMKSLKAEVTATRSTLTGMQTSLTVMQVLLKESDKRRRIEFALAHAKSLPVCDPDSNKQIESNRFVRIDSQGRAMERYDCDHFIISTLFYFRRGFGIYLPTGIACLKAGYPHPVKAGEERESRLQGFQNVVVHHLNVLLGSKPMSKFSGNRDGGNGTECSLWIIINGSKVPGSLLGNSSASNNHTTSSHVRLTARRLEFTSCMYVL